MAELIALCCSTGDHRSSPTWASPSGSRFFSQTGGCGENSPMAVIVVERENTGPACIREAHITASSDALVTDACHHVESHVDGVRGGCGLRRLWAGLVLCGAPTSRCTSHCSFPSGDGGAGHSRRRETDAAPGDLCPEEAPVRGTGEASSGQQ